MYDVLHQLIDRVHGWRSEEDRVNAHQEVEDYRAEQEGTADTESPDGVSPAVLDSSKLDTADESNSAGKRSK